MRLLTPVPADRHRGFALVEVLVVLVIVAIVAAVVLVAVDSAANDPSAARCRAEAREFESAVHRYYERHDPHVWPPSGRSNSVLTVAVALRVQGDLDSNSLARSIGHLDGSQRTPVDTVKGCTYDFDAHTTDATRCG
jgi:prepilin-type N-terminal cleavage/methylation domain-containing protein